MAFHSDAIKQTIETGGAYLGIELGSTRIKAVLIGEDFAPIASGSYGWENQYVDQTWTYDLETIHAGVRACYADLARDVRERYGLTLRRIRAMGVSAMMHGYLALDAKGQLLVPFRTWRNTSTGEASAALSDLFGFNIPLRWSVAHLYQAILNGEAHVSEVRFLTTLSGYIHWLLTGEKVLGVGDASGMFPIDTQTHTYDGAMLARFDALVAPRRFPWRLGDILPQVRTAGEPAGALTEAGARFLDPTGALEPGAALCPPEGDAGTGMTATDSVAVRTGNVSAGTSIFLMAVLEKPLSKMYPEIDIVTTPAGDPVAMVHCNNCTSDLDAWIRLLGEAARALGADFAPDALYATLYAKALEGEADCGGLTAYNYLSGEPMTGFSTGCPLFVRGSQGRMTLANFMRAHVFSALGALRVGMDILEGERVALDSVTGHGGYFKTPGVGQRALAAALKTPVTVMETAGEGGPWGMALLAAFSQMRAPGEALGGFLAKRVFAASARKTLAPSQEEAEGFAAFMQRYRRGLAVEAAAVDALGE